MWEEVANCPNFLDFTLQFLGRRVYLTVFSYLTLTFRYIKVLTCSQIWKFRDY